jgi:hypothetical protein
MEIKTSSFVARFYTFFHGSLPDDFCTLFWGSIAAFLLLPFTIPTKIVLIFFAGPPREILQRCKPEEHDDTLLESFRVGLSIYIAIAILAVIGFGPAQIFGIVDLLKKLSIPLIILSLFLLGTSSVGFVVLVIWLIKLAVSKYKTFKQSKAFDYNQYQYPPKPTFMENTRDTIAAIKGKYCTKINWK